MRWRSGEDNDRRFMAEGPLAKHYGGSIGGDALDSPAAARDGPRSRIVGCVRRVVQIGN